jgi:hypothetical protein
VDKIQATYLLNKRKLTDGRRMEMIKAVLADFRRVLFVVDALDESVEEEAFAQAFSDLLQYDTDNDAVIQMILTSREDLNVERSIKAIATSRLSLSGQMEDDIRTYISSEVRARLQSKKLKLADPDLADRVVRSLVEHAEGMCVPCKSGVLGPRRR